MGCTIVYYFAFYVQQSFLNTTKAHHISGIVYHICGIARPKKSNIFQNKFLVGILKFFLHIIKVKLILEFCTHFFPLNSQKNIFFYTTFVVYYTTYVVMLHHICSILYNICGIVYHICGFPRIPYTAQGGFTGQSAQQQQWHLFFQTVDFCGAKHLC